MTSHGPGRCASWGLAKPMALKISQRKPRPVLQRRRNLAAPAHTNANALKQHNRADAGRRQVQTGPGLWSQLQKFLLRQGVGDIAAGPATTATWGKREPPKELGCCRRGSGRPAPPEKNSTSSNADIPSKGVALVSQLPEPPICFRSGQVVGHIEGGARVAEREACEPCEHEPHQNANRREAGRQKACSGVSATKPAALVALGWAGLCFLRLAFWFCGLVLSLKRFGLDNLRNDQIMRRRLRAERSR